MTSGSRSSFLNSGHFRYLDGCVRWAGDNAAHNACWSYRFANPFTEYGNDCSVSGPNSWADGAGCNYAHLYPYAITYAHPGSCPHADCHAFPYTYPYSHASAYPYSGPHAHHDTYAYTAPHSHTNPYHRPWLCL